MNSNKPDILKEVATIVFSNLSNKTQLNYSLLGGDLGDIMFLYAYSTIDSHYKAIAEKLTERMLSCFTKQDAFQFTYCNGIAGTGDIVQAVRHMRKMNSAIAQLTSMREDELFEAAKQFQVPYELVEYVHKNGKLPVVNFAAGGVATPADAALMMQLGAEGVFVGSGIFKSGNPAKRANAIVKAVTNYTDAKIIAELSEDLGETMVGINESEIQILMAERGK